MYVMATRGMKTSSSMYTWPFLCNYIFDFHLTSSPWVFSISSTLLLLSFTQIAKAVCKLIGLSAKPYIYLLPLKASFIFMLLVLRTRLSGYIFIFIFIEFFKLVRYVLFVTITSICFPLYFSIRALNFLNIQKTYDFAFKKYTRYIIQKSSVKRIKYLLL